MKYELLQDDTITIDGHKLTRIRAIRSFDNVKRGDLGGYIEKHLNLHQHGLCWVYENAKVYGNAMITGDAKVIGSAVAKDNAIISGSSKVLGNVIVGGTCIIRDRAVVIGHSILAGLTIVKDDCVINIGEDHKNKIVRNVVLSDCILLKCSICSDEIIELIGDAKIIRYSY